MSRRAAGGLLLAAVLIGWLVPEAARACAICFGDDETLAGFTVSWLFLVMMPFAVIGSIGGWAFWIRRRGGFGESGDHPQRPARIQKESEA
ncbi:MAG: hypothetical protein ACE5IM_02815 [Nitrospinota bacterium]